MATIRRELRIEAPAEQVWPLVGDPGRIHEWFPGIVDCRVEADGDTTVRHVTLASGLTLAEEVLTVDPLLRRFQYRITGGIFREHLGTVDVIDLGDGTCLGVYSTDARPDVMALVIGGATADALANIRTLALAGAGTTAEAP